MAADPLGAHKANRYRSGCVPLWWRVVERVDGDGALHSFVSRSMAFFRI